MSGEMRFCCWHDPPERHCAAAPLEQPCSHAHTQIWSQDIQAHQTPENIVTAMQPLADVCALQAQAERQELQATEPPMISDMHCWNQQAPAKMCQHSVHRLCRKGKAVGGEPAFQQVSPPQCRCLALHGTGKGTALTTPKAITDLLPRIT